MIPVPLDKALAASPDGLHTLFCEYAKFLPDAPNKPYAIRFAFGPALVADDTALLMEMFTRKVTALRRRTSRRKQ